MVCGIIREVLLVATSGTAAGRNAAGAAANEDVFTEETNEDGVDRDDGPTAGQKTVCPHGNVKPAVPRISV